MSPPLHFILIISIATILAVAAVWITCYLIDELELRNRRKRVQEEVKRFTDALDERFR